MKNVIKKHKKKKKWPSVVIFSCIGIIVKLYFINDLEPDEVIKNYAEHINSRNYQEMYAVLDAGSQGTISLQEFISRNQKIYEGIEAKNVKFSLQKIEDGPKSDKTAFYSVSMDTVAGKISFDNIATFHRIKGKGYRLVWNHSMIFPHLDASDKVSVSRRKARRGSIYDRNGNLLAGQGSGAAVGLVPGKMNKNAEADITRLAELLEVSAESIHKKASAKWVKEDSFVPLKTIEKLETEGYISADDEDLQQNKKLQDELLKIPGVMITDIEARVYPFKEKTSHLIGYVQNITAEELKEHKGEGYSSNSQIGKSGVEKLYEEELRGKDGCEIAIITSKGKEKESLASVMQSDGRNIAITIDANLQSALYEQFKEDKSCSAAMNPKTGEVLALVSTPAYNPYDFVNGMSEAKWDALNNNEKKPLFNRFRAAWCPGSSFKPVIAALGVSVGQLDPSEDFGNEGRRWQKDKSWGNYFVTTLHAYDEVILKNALIYSDNIYFAKAALKIGGEVLSRQLDKLGFRERMPFEIWMTESQYSSGESIKEEVQLADTGYGQGQLLISPLHLASMYTAFVNEGSMLTPYLRNRQQGQAAYWKEKVFTKEAIKIVQEGLIEVIENPHGTGRACRIEGLRLAGKTGTAEIKATKEDTSGTELGWFAVFTTEREAEDALLIVSMVEDVKERGGSTYVVKKDKGVLQQFYFNGDEMRRE